MERRKWKPSLVLLWGRIHQGLPIFLRMIIYEFVCSLTTFHVRSCGTLWRRLALTLCAAFMNTHTRQSIPSVNNKNSNCSFTCTMSVTLFFFCHSLHFCTPILCADFFFFLLLLLFLLFLLFLVARWQAYSVDWNLVSKDTFISGSWDNTIKLWTPERYTALYRINYLLPIYLPLSVTSNPFFFFFFKIKGWSLWIHGMNINM